MNDLWQLVGDDFTHLTHILSRVLSNRDAESQIRQALEEAEKPWSEITQAYRAEQSFPKNVIRLALASDCLRMMALAVLADGEVEDDEIYTAYSLSQPLSKILASLGRYSRYDNLDINESHDFLQAFIDDPNWFGGEDSCPTNFLGLHICTYVSMIKSDQTAFETYEGIIRTILAGVFGGDPRTVGEHEFLDKFNELFESFGIIAANTADDRKRNDRLSTTFDSPYAEQDDDEWIDPLLDDSINQSTSREASVESAPPEQVLEEAMADLDSLIGLDGVKAEVNRLMSFLKIQEHRKRHGLRESGQTLHFVFTGNPGTGKTTVARIVSKILFGFKLLKTTRVIECDRSDLVGGYLGQTAIKTDEKIDSALDGVLFIDEAYALAGDYGYGDMYGDEAINTMLKRMEDHRDRLVVIVAGYPKPMQQFIRANPGLESRFTRYINFDDYTIADLCRIFEKFCRDAEYNLSTSARAYACILFTIAYNQRDERFGNARFIRNVFERATSLHSERLAKLRHDQISRDLLVTLDSSDISFESAKNVTAQDVDLLNARWAAKCPGCGNASKGTMKFLGQRVTCKRCNQSFMFPWWSVLPDTVTGIPVDYLQSTEDQRGVVEQPAVRDPVKPPTQPMTMGADDFPPAYDNWKPDRSQGTSLLEEGLNLLKRRECDAAIRCFDHAIRVDWPSSDPGQQDYYECRALAYEMNGDDRPMQAIDDYNEGHRSNSMGHYQQSRNAYLSAVKHDPEFLWAANNLAWLYATNHDSTIRNGREAVKHGLYACCKSDWHCWSFIETLAASYAEAGDFNKAVQCSERALKMVPPEKTDGEQEMMDRFRSGRPYRQD